MNLPPAAISKSFLLLFFKKEELSFFLNAAAAETPEYPAQQPLLRQPTVAL